MCRNKRKIAGARRGCWRHALTAGRLLAISGTLLLPQGGRADEAFVTEWTDNDMVVLDLESGKLLKSIRLGLRPDYVVMAHGGGTVYGVSANGPYVSIVDTATRKKVGQLGLPEKAGGIAISADDRWVYTVGAGEGHLDSIDTQQRHITQETLTGGPATGVAAVPDGKTILVALQAGQLVLVNGKDHKIIEAKIAVGRHPTGIAVDAEGKRAYVANTESGDVSVVDLVARNVIGTVKAGKAPRMIALAQGKGFVTDQAGKTVAVFDLSSLKPLGEVTVGEEPQGVEATRDGASVYVVNGKSNSLSKIDVASLKVVATLPLGDGPRGLGTFLRRTP